MSWMPGRKQGKNGSNPGPAHKAAKKSRQRDSDPTYWPDFGFIPPPAVSLSPGEAIRHLPEQYKRVVTKPYAETFLMEMGQADWAIVWVQLLGYAIIAGLLGFLSTLLPFAHTVTSSNASGLSSPAVIRALTLGTSLGLIVLIPVLFLLLMAILYLLTRAYGGRGKFLQQCYTTLLFLVPFGVFVSILSVLPFVGGFLSAFLGAILFLYSIVLETFAIIAVHRLSGGKATASAVITALLLIPLAVGLLSLWTFLFISIFH